MSISPNMPESRPDGRSMTRGRPFRCHAETLWLVGLGWKGSPSLSLCLLAPLRFVVRLYSLPPLSSPSLPACLIPLDNSPFGVLCAETQTEVAVGKWVQPSQPAISRQVGGENTQHRYQQKSAAFMPCFFSPHLAEQVRWDRQGCACVRVCVCAVLGLVTGGLSLSLSDQRD